MTNGAEDRVSQRFLERAYEVTVDTERGTINGHKIMAEMNLESDEYLRIVDSLQNAGYVSAPGGMAQHITLTDKGIRRVSGK